MTSRITCGKSSDRTSRKACGMIIGVVADDITGANDIGIMFRNAGCTAHIYTYRQPGDFRAQLSNTPPADVAILDTNSRLDTRETAYQKVFEATRELAEAGCTRFFNKTCSVFRGNIGAEFDAMLDALGSEFAVVVLGFPKNGRRTIDGIHYVHGKRLEESEFRNDPIHPMTRSSLVDILQSQTSRKVDLINFEVIAQGPQVLRAEIDRTKDSCNYLILDVEDQQSLKTIAQAAAGEAIYCGSSALAEEMPSAWGFQAKAGYEVSLPQAAGGGILILAGSLMPQTRLQVEYLKAKGIQAFELNTAALFEPNLREAEISLQTGRLADLLVQGKDVLLHTPNRVEAIEATREAGQRYGLNPTETGRLISDALASITKRVQSQTGLNRLVVAGGETSAAVCEKLGIRSMAVWEEIQPGLPSCISLTEPRMFLVLKSGSFGNPDFLESATRHLKSSEHLRTAEYQRNK